MYGWGRQKLLQCLEEWAVSGVKEKWDQWRECR